VEERIAEATLVDENDAKTGVLSINGASKAGRTGAYD
jgi:hypothetical protein